MNKIYFRAPADNLGADDDQGADDDADDDADDVSLILSIRVAKIKGNIFLF